MWLGVKQGDPLSPWLYNEGVDEILSELPHEFCAWYGQHRINAIAYANDIVLYSESKFAMQHLLQRVESFYCFCGLKINAANCVSMSMEADRKVKMTFETDPILSINGSFIWHINVDQYMKYLRVEMGVLGIKWKGCGDMAFLQAISRAPLSTSKRWNF